MDSPREWALSMGSHPARIVNGRMVNSFKFRDRVLIGRKYKSYIDALGEITELIDLDNDFYEQNNIIQRNDKEIILEIEKFSIILDQIPGEDNQPMYKPGESAVKSIPLEELLGMSIKGALRSNKAPLPGEASMGTKQQE